MKPSRLLISALVAGAMLVACSKTDQMEAQREIQRQAADISICAQVTAAATALDPATLQLVKVSCTHGTVTLQGQVRSATERAQLVTAAKKVKGVRNVVVKIDINPKAPTGNEIAEDLALGGKVRFALAQQTGMNAFKIDVAAHHGIVTISGSVPSRAVKTVALDTIKGVDGVKGIVDNLKVQK